MTPTCTIGRMFKVIHILDAVESPPVSSSRMQCGQLYILTTPSNTTRLKVHGLQLISAISCPKAGWFITWEFKTALFGEQVFFEMGIYPIFATLLVAVFCFFLIHLHLMNLHSFPTATTTMTRSCIPWGSIRLWPMVLYCRSSARVWR